jgi:2-polyprenyl-3-methyl-5-hydroxy-6-metoxy-1,4-benzoquinol methylase
MNSLQAIYEDKSESYYSGVRLDILPLLPKHSKKILEIGCGTGNTLAYLKDKGYCDWTCGVDIFDDAIESAKEKLDCIYQCNIEEMKIPLNSESIDIILCLDVLEHLINPQKVVAYLHTLLAPGGIIIASIPNVRHYSVVIPLIFQNKWEYTDSGLLDSTHLRFFVKSTAITLMNSSGLHVQEVLSTKGKKAKLLNAITMGIFDSFYSVQYLIKAVNQQDE